MKNNSDRDFQQLLDFIGREADFMGEDHSIDRQRLRDYVEGLRATAIDTAELPGGSVPGPAMGGIFGDTILAGPGDLTATGNETVYYVEEMVRIIKNYEVLLPWVVKLAQTLSPEEVAKFKLLDMLAALKWTGVFESGFGTLLSALYGAAEIGIKCIDSPIIKRKVGSDRAAKRLETQKSKKDQISSDVLMLAAPARKANSLLTDEGVAKKILLKFRELHPKSPPWTQDGVASRIRKLVRAGQLAEYKPHKAVELASDA